MKSNKYFNKVNILSASRVFFSLIASMLIFTGNLNLIIAAFVIIGLSETTDLIDGYVARRDKIVTDLGKILDPMSDSIARFFYFFVLAYHGLFPMWFLVIFYLRDIFVAKIRLNASQEGFVMGARFSGKLKSTALFIGQYLLLISLIANLIYRIGYPSEQFIYFWVVFGVLTIAFLMIVYKIRGSLLILICVSAAALAAIVYSFLLIDFYVDYIYTLLLAYVLFGISLYALVDYMFVYIKITSNVKITIVTSIVITLFFLITPIGTDFWYNGILFNLPKSETKTVYYTDLSVAQSIKAKYPDSFQNIADVEYQNGSYYICDSETKMLYKINKNDNDYEMVFSIRTGYIGKIDIAVANYNNHEILIISNYLISNKIDLIDLNGIDLNKRLKKQIKFEIPASFYIKSLSYANGNLYIEEDKLLKLAYNSSLDQIIKNKILYNSTGALE